MDGTTQLSAEDLMGWSRAREMASQQAQGKLLVRIPLAPISPSPTFCMLAYPHGELRLV